MNYTTTQFVFIYLTFINFNGTNAQSKEGGLSKVEYEQKRLNVV